MTDDDIRSMLRSKAAEVEVSPDAWEQITARIQEAPPRPIARRLAVAGAAAAIVGTVFVANLPGTSPQVASPPETSTPVGRTADETAVHDAVGAWLTAVLADHLPDDSNSYVTSDVDITGDTAQVRITGSGIETEVFLQRLSGRPGWGVTAAASELIPIFEPTYDGSDLVANATAEAAGHLTKTYVVDGESVAGGEEDVTFRQPVALGHQVEGADAVSVRLVLELEDGTFAISETPAQIRRDPAIATGSYVAIWPAVDSVGLATLQQDADAGRRRDLLDPLAVAGFFLSEVLPRGESATSPTLGEFQQGDNTSGEVAYTLSDGGSGTIMLRRTGGDETIWTVTGAVSDDLEIVKTSVEGSARLADVRSELTGTLTWTGATPIEVEAGQTVSIGRSDSPEIGSYPVVIRLLDGDRTLAIVAGMS